MFKKTILLVKENVSVNDVKAHLILKKSEKINKLLNTKK